MVGREAAAAGHPPTAVIVVKPKRSYIATLPSLVVSSQTGRFSNRGRSRS